jgi:hypothetical protein
MLKAPTSGAFMFVSSFNHKLKNRIMIKKVLWGVGLTIVGAFVGVWLHDKWKDHKAKKNLKDGDPNPANPNLKWSTKEQKYI